MKATSILDLPILAYSVARSLNFNLQYQLLNTLAFALPGARKFIPKLDVPTLLEMRREALKLFAQDSENIRKGIYPISVLTPELPTEHLLRIPKIMFDGLSMYQRRMRGKTTEFDEAAKDYLADVPRYYRRNFHFQTDGYLSRQSAELYDHQVELLFGGAADAMRRLIIPPMRRALGSTDGRGLTILEIGAGTGRATRFVRLAFPKAKIVACDLSDPYLHVAQKKLDNFSRIDFVQADGGKLPFGDREFDAVISVFLFHELPLDARKAVLSESRRALKKSGFVGLVDSLQKGEHRAFDKLLGIFPENYHEPFYRNYIAHPMEQLLRDEGFMAVKKDRGFYSKVCWGIAPK